MKDKLINYHSRALRKYISEYNKEQRAEISAKIKEKRKEFSEKMKAERKGQKIIREIKIPKGIKKEGLVKLVMSRASMKIKAENDFKNKTALEGFEFKGEVMQPKGLKVKKEKPSPANKRSKQEELKTGKIDKKDLKPNSRKIIEKIEKIDISNQGKGKEERMKPQPQINKEIKEAVDNIAKSEGYKGMSVSKDVNRFFNLVDFLGLVEYPNKFTSEPQRNIHLKIYKEGLDYGKKKKEEIKKRMDEEQKKKAKKREEELRKNPKPLEQQKKAPTKKEEPNKRSKQEEKKNIVDIYDFLETKPTKDEVFLFLLKYKNLSSKGEIFDKLSENEFDETIEYLQNKGVKGLNVYYDFSSAATKEAMDTKLTEYARSLLKKSEPKKEAQKPKPAPAKKEAPKPKPAPKKEEPKQESEETIVENWNTNVNNIELEQKNKRLTQTIKGLINKKNLKFINLDMVISFDVKLTKKLMDKYPFQKVLDGYEKFVSYLDSGSEKMIGKDRVIDYYTVSDGRIV